MTSPLVYDAISRQWRTRFDQSHDYTLIKNDTLFRTSFTDSFVFESEYRRAEQVKQDLLDRHNGQTLEEVLDGADQETGEGSCYCVQSTEPMVVPVPRKEDFAELLCSDLTLVHGIGLRTAHLLRQRGYHRIEELIHHRRFARPAADCLAILRSGDPEQVLRLVQRRHSPSHPLVLRTADLHDVPSFVFFDLETLGFFSRPIILFGLARVSDGRLEISQYILRSMEEELPALLATRAFLGEEPVLVSFNGRAFDLPYLRERYAFYGESSLVPALHYDLLAPSRRRYRQNFPDCRLTTLERRIFGIDRTPDIPSSMVPEFYQTYLTTGNPGPLLPIVRHNRQDIVTLARLFCHLREESDECH